MTTLQYVDLETARAARGTRIVTSGVVPSPWSEAAKGLFELAGLPAMVVARSGEATEVDRWTGAGNVPAVLHEEEPTRTCWAAIVGLAARLAEAGAIVSTDPLARAADFGLIEMIAGEAGLGWNARLGMIQVSIESSGARGFPLTIASYLAKRYGHTGSVSLGELRARIGRQLAILGERLAKEHARGHTYFGGERPSAVDVYGATFLTLLSEIDEAACPQLAAPRRAALSSAREMAGDLVPAELFAHRKTMFERHLTWPIRLS